ncbi:MAG: uncharacterized protein QOD77_386 [Thermoplasmata archaeon]|jgi:catechol 2,3-dioxygenase-like lactoylglutathione lyase family enzyme|nr:uncharacterized protein [Thermoplasmata archaeon]
MRPSLSLVTLGVADLERARRFYAKLGWETRSPPGGGVVFVPLRGVVLGLWPRTELAKDAQVADTAPGFGGFALAHNCRNEAEVDAVLKEAVAAGATLRKPAHKVFWGGYSGYFADPDGHLWEVAFNPSWPLDGEGKVVLPP